MYKQTKIEEMDTVRFREEVVGYSPLAKKNINVERGREGVVIHIEDGEYEIQVDDPNTGLPLCFVRVQNDLIYTA
jgi:hypothetical protein